ncbi:toprim domain-containing protein [Streptomyces sp. NPDC003691]
MLTIPYLGHDGRVLAIRFRCLQDHDHRKYGHGKYNSLKDDPPRLYGISDIHQAGDTLDLTEGEFDRLILRSLGLYAVAAPGASLWLGRHRRMIAGFSRVRVWGDPDDGGAQFTAKVCRSLPRSGKGVRLKVGDVSETYLREGARALLALAESAALPPSVAESHPRQAP